MLALRRQRPRTGQAARSARSQTINPVPKPALQCFASHATHAARQNHSLGYLAPTPSDRTLRPNPHSSPHRHRPASRDFVPWRFLDAGRISTPKVSSLPASKNLTNSGLASAQARAPSFESDLPQHHGMYTAIRSAVRGASMQRLIRVEFQLGRPATRR